MTAVKQPSEVQYLQAEVKQIGNRYKDITVILALKNGTRKKIIFRNLTLVLNCELFLKFYISITFVLKIEISELSFFISNICLSVC